MRTTWAQGHKEAVVRFRPEAPIQVVPTPPEASGKLAKQDAEVSEASVAPREEAIQLWHDPQRLKELVRR